MPPVEDHPVHELTRAASDGRYGCHNGSREFSGYFAPHRQRVGGAFEITAQFIPHTMSRECRYDRSLKDPRCGGCCHAGSGERYAAGVLERAL